MIINSSLFLKIETIHYNTSKKRWWLCFLYFTSLEYLLILNSKLLITHRHQLHMWNRHSRNNHPCKNTCIHLDHLCSFRGHHKGRHHMSLWLKINFLSFCLVFWWRFISSNIKQFLRFLGFSPKISKIISFLLNVQDFSSAPKYRLIQKYDLKQPNFPNI